MTSSKIRLNRLIALQTGLSRRQADQTIKSGRVTVNHQPARLGEKVDLLQDQVFFDDKPLSTQTLHYLALNKPPGYITTRRDEQNRPTVMDLIPQQYHHLHPIGRLDLDSQGLLILTNDGTLTYKLTHPKFNHPKVYHVQIDSRPTSKTLRLLKTGVPLKDGKTLPALVKILKKPPEFWLEITLTEGRHRQIRRMFAALNHQVLTLIRVQIGQLKLDVLGNRTWTKLNQNHLKLLTDFKT